MMRRRVILTAALALLGAASAPLGADTYPRQPGIDALNYAFRLVLSDSTDEISGELTFDLRIVAAGVQSVRLDLINASPALQGRGMRVLGVSMDGRALQYTHTNDVLNIALASAPATGQRLRIVVRYRGTPATGLKIANNRYGDRTFFSDNWPNKARHWLPTIDHVYDKAMSEFIVEAPSLYQVVSNGLQREGSAHGDLES